MGERGDRAEGRHEGRRPDAGHRLREPLDGHPRVLFRLVHGVSEGPRPAPSVEKTMGNTGVETRVATGVKTRVESRVKRPAKKLSSAEKIVAYLVSNPTASAHELSIAVNLTVKGIEKNLKALRESGRLRHVGPTKGGHWEVLT